MSATLMGIPSGSGMTPATLYLDEVGGKGKIITHNGISPSIRTFLSHKIWRAGDLDVNSFRVYVAGLSGETRFVRNPSYDPNEPEDKTIIGPGGVERTEVVNPTHFTLRKTLELRYDLPGSADARKSVKPVFRGQRWVMR